MCRTCGLCRGPRALVPVPEGGVLLCTKSPPAKLVSTHFGIAPHNVSEH